MTHMHRGIALVLVAVAAFSGCRRTPETVAQPTDTAAPPPPTCDSACQRRIADSIAAANAERDRLAREAADRERAAAVERMRTMLMAPVYFDYDAAEIRGDARAALDAKLPILRANPGLQIRISGHADERGSDQYNDALGQQRAASAKRYLTDNGIDGARIAIVSYGEQRPASMGSDESAWSRNRRAEFEITAGTIAPPQ
ncbi:MAG TPA: OmpA family protein [Gemmatimonadaceae bacterium]